jgi:hypothetical protein
MFGRVVVVGELGFLDVSPYGLVAVHLTSIRTG